MISPSFVVYVIVTVAVPMPSVLIFVTEVSFCENDSVMSRTVLSLLDQLQLPGSGPAFACRFIDVPSRSSLLTGTIFTDNLFETGFEFSSTHKLAVSPVVLSMSHPSSVDIQRANK